jgi:hypothetical protein
VAAEVRSFERFSITIRSAMVNSEIELDVAPRMLGLSGPPRRRAGKVGAAHGIADQGQDVGVDGSSRGWHQPNATST